jgi:hypothetical protein
VVTYIVAQQPQPIYLQGEVVVGAVVVGGAVVVVGGGAVVVGGAAARPIRMRTSSPTGQSVPGDGTSPST